MVKRFISAIAFVVYAAALVKVMVFKDIPLIRLGHVMLNFGGTDASGQSNLVPFKTIVSYLLGGKGLIIAGINLVGNIILLVPLGFLAPLVFRDLTWRASLVLAVGSGLVLEGLQVLLRVGIFDIDDVLLNALGVFIGYGAYTFLCRWVRPH